MPSKLGGEFDRTVAWVRETTGLTFRLRTVNGLHQEGDKCWAVAVQTFSPEWTIKVERKAPVAVAIDGLLHEVAHLLQFRKETYIHDTNDQHTPVWGKEYAKLTKAYHKWVEKTRAE
jgi:hypothetical protein